MNARRSIGHRHSVAVKKGIERSLISIPEREMIQMDMQAKRASTRAKVWQGMIALLGKAEIGRCIPDPDAIEQQLKNAWQAGYVAALRDVSKERQRMERARNYDAFPIMSMQEAEKISHVYA